MKKRISIIERLKQLYSLHETAAKIIFIVTLLIVYFSIGYSLSSILLNKNISENEFKFYEEVAHSVYEQKDAFIYEVPDGARVSLTDTTITVSSDNLNYRGKVIARLQNGELVCTRSNEKGVTIILNFLIGMIFALIALLATPNRFFKFK